MKNYRQFLKNKWRCVFGALIMAFAFLQISSAQSAAYINIASNPPGADVEIGIKTVNGVVTVGTGRNVGKTPVVVELQPSDMNWSTGAAVLYVSFLKEGYIPSMDVISFGTSGPQPGKVYNASAILTRAWSDCQWVEVGAQKSHQTGAPWLPNGYFITMLDLDGPKNYEGHDAPIVGRVHTCNLDGVLWNNCQWFEVGPQKSHQSNPGWLPEGYFITQLDLDGLREFSAHDTPVVGRVRGCNLIGYTKWSDCQWIEIGAINSHNGSGNWCPNGYFITQIDFDSVPAADSHDSPVIGRIQCCKPAQ